MRWKGRVHMNFSDRLKKLRESKGLSQEELANMLGMPRTSITHYESGKDRVPRQDRLYKMADFFDVSGDYLLGRTNTKKFTYSEKDFVEDSKELTVKELKEKYDLNIDGKTATKEEIEGAIAFIRSLRNLK